MARTRGGFAASLFFSVSAWAQGPAGIVASPAELTFKGALNGDTVPPQVITVTSVNPATPVRVTVNADDGAGRPPMGWITVRTGTFTTPARVVVAVDPIFLEARSYRARVVLTAAGAEQYPVYIPVTFEVENRPPNLEVAPKSLRFVTRAQAPVSMTQTLFVRNAGGGGPISFNVLGEGRSPWLSITPDQGRTQRNVPVLVRITVDPQGLRPGAYRGAVIVDAKEGGRELVPVALFVAGGGPIIGLTPAGFQFEMVQGQGTSVTRNLTISNLGGDTLNWTAELERGRDWLTLGATSGSATATTSSSLTLSTANTTLTAGPYYGLLRISSAQALNSPQFFPVILNVLPAGSQSRPAPSPSGLVFTAVSGAAAPAPQLLRVFTSSQQALGYQAASTTEDRLGWLSLSRTAGSASTTSPGQINVLVDHSRLKPDIYHGEANIALSAADVRVVNITLVVIPPPSSSASTGRLAAGCTPTRVVATHTGLVSNFSTPASWPVPLTVRLTDDCGDPVVNGQAVFTFSSGDPPLPAALSNVQNGSYTATWIPRSAAQQVTITARATAANLPVAVAQLTGGISPNRAPVLFDDGTVNAFSRTQGAPLAPGTWVEIYGADLAASAAQPGTLPFPTSFNGTTVLVGGVEAPLAFVSPGQVNAQIPMELASNRQYQVVISANNAFSSPDTISLAAVQPGITNSAGRINAHHNADFTLITSDSPAKPGEVITIYLVGMGLTDTAVVSGAPSPASLAKTRVQPKVTIDGKEAVIFFAGLTPDAVGLYQITLRVPQDVGLGDLTLVVTQDGISANETLVPVR